VTWVRYTPERPNEWLKALSEGTGVLHAIGDKAGAEMTSEERFTWIPDAIETGPGRYHMENEEAVSEARASFDVMICTGEYGRLFKLRKDLEAWVDLLFGPPQGAPDAGGGYVIGRSSTPRGNLTGAMAWSVTVPVTLKDLVTRRRFPPVAVTETTFTVQTTDLDGSDPTTEIDWPGS
jgi:hypothetical protein